MRADPPHPDRIGGAARAVLFAVLLLTPLVFTGATLEAFETPKLALLQLGCLALAALGLIALIERPVGWRNVFCEPLNLAVMLFGISATISTACSISPRVSLFGAIESLAGLTTALCFCVLFAVARGFTRNDSDVRRLLIASIVATAIVAGYALVQAVRLDPYPWKASSTIGGFVRPFSTIGHANHLGAFLVTSLPIVALAALRSRGWLRLLCVAIGVMSIAAIALTLSRGAWLAGAVLAVFGAVALIRRGSRRSLATAALAMTICGALGWQLAGPQFRHAVGERVGRFADSAGRWQLWRAGWAMFNEHPVAGTGLDGFALVFGQHRPAEYWLTEWNTTPTRAHNEIVQVLATQGAIGGLALAGLLVALVLSVRRALQNGANPTLVWCLVAGLTAFGVQNLFNFTVTSTGLLAAVMLGCIARLGTVPAPVVEATPRWGWRWGSAALAGVVAVAGVLGSLWADMQCRTAERVMLTDPVAAVAEFESAVARDPMRDLLWFKLSQGARAAARVTANRSERKQLNERARSAQQMAIDLVPEHPIHRAHFAHLLAELAMDGDASGDDVAVAYRDALHLDPLNPTLLAEAGHAAWSRGNAERARRYLSLGMSLDPKQANLRALSGLVAMSEGHYEEASQHLEVAAGGQWHGNADGFWQTMSVWSACLVRLNRAAQASAIAQEVHTQRPDWPGPYYTHGYALLMLGRSAEAHAAFAELADRWPQHPLAAEAKKQLARMK